MRQHRFEVEARLEDGMAEAMLGGRALQLVTVCLRVTRSMTASALTPLQQVDHRAGVRRADYDSRPKRVPGRA